MASSTGFDHHNHDYLSQPRGFLTPPPTWKSSRCSPETMRSEKKPRRIPDIFHVIHKIPSGDSPYVRAKHVQLVDKDPSRAISLFWAAINSGDRVDSALKDMAVVMKQLDRSDEAIEAIKSFRHLSSPESQESLDNILVELYKQSGRIEEEIEMLQRKLKQVEEGIAFSGKRTKIARSQGKKIQITVEKEYSRLLGNLAWAFVQQKDFKSAEENYRKALSFEPDKNKQCNLAVCLMHMNQLTEAKFLLQTVKDSFGNGYVDESYAKSYERASQSLAEFESRKQTEYNTMKPFGGQSESGFCSQKNSDDKKGMQSSPLPTYVRTNNGPFTGYPHEKRADFDWRKNHYERHHMGQEQEAYSAGKKVYESPHCYRNIPKVPFTQPRRCSRSGDQRKEGGLTEYGSYCRKLFIGTSTRSEQSYVSQNVNNCPSTSPGKIPKVALAQFSNWIRNSSGKPLEDNNNKPLEASEKEIACQISKCEHKKSWADMVEEDEREFENRINDDIICETPEPHDRSRKMESIDLGRGYNTQPEKAALSMNQPVRRSLCFDQNQDPNIQKHDCTSPLTKTVLNFERQVGGRLSEDFGSGNNRRRLQVFQDITSSFASPTH